MLWFWAAAAVSLMTAVVHIIVGGGEVMAPLMAADMPPIARETLALAVAALAVALHCQVAFWILPRRALLVALAAPGLIAEGRR